MLELGDQVIAPLNPKHKPFDISAFLSGTLKMGCDVDYLNLAALPTTSHSLQTAAQLLSPPAEGKRKRRRGERIECDPDVSTRMCSICGYQGKWVSEMIRHKRVHTNERPFKCRYCSRTSKWKADLIRHVAKTHGIRVVSKYSRSKTFDSSTTNLTDRPEEDKPRVYACEKRPESEAKSTSPTSVITTASKRSLSASPPASPPKTPITYRCVICLFEQDTPAVLANHLKNVHASGLYECTRCRASFPDSESAVKHTNTTECTTQNVILNFAPIYAANNVKSLFSLTAPLSVSTLMSSSSTRPTSRADSSPDSGLQVDCDDEAAETLTCDECPFRGNNDELRTHKAGHEMPKGLLSYKCRFCSWFSKRKQSIKEHMRLHTTTPQDFMPEVEKNLITRASSICDHPVPSMPSIISPQAAIPRENAQKPLASLSPSAFDLTSALLALQTVSPSYIGAMTSLLASSPVFFPPSPLTGPLSMPNLLAQSAGPETNMAAATVVPPRPAPSIHNCAKCDARMPSEVALKSHDKFHGSCQRHACPICDYAAGKSANLVRHMRFHHKIGDESPAISQPEEPEDDLQATDDDDVVDVEQITE